MGGGVGVEAVAVVGMVSGVLVVVDVLEVKVGGIRYAHFAAGEVGASGVDLWRPHISIADSVTSSQLGSG